MAKQMKRKIWTTFLRHSNKLVSSYHQQVCVLPSKTEGMDDVWQHNVASKAISFPWLFMGCSEESVPGFGASMWVLEKFLQMRAPISEIRAHRFKIFLSAGRSCQSGLE